MSSPGNEHIVMADDDAGVTDMFREIADDQCPGLKFTLAGNGKETPELLNNIPIADAIILNINMPLMNGKDCPVNVRRNPAFNGIPVIMLSSANDEQEIKSCLSAGANYYFVKPGSYVEFKIIGNSVCIGNYDYAA